RVTDDDRKLLRKLKIYDGRTVEDLFVELQETGARIGAIEKRRQELGAQGELVVKNRAARFQWIRAINALVAILASVEADPAPILGPIREAEAAAERRSARGGGPTDGSDVVTDPDVVT